MDICNQLAGTGVNQYVLVATVCVFFAISLLAVHRRSWWILVVPILLTPLFTSPLHAQSYGNCPPAESPNETGEFLLDEDVFSMTANSSAAFSILENDSQLQDDPIDWRTVDLDPNTPGMQDQILFTHSDDSLASCGSVSALSFGAIQVSLNEECSYYDDESNYIAFPQPESFTLSYTVQTLGALDPPSPATITILVNESLPPAVVVASNDYINYGNAITTVQILDNDTTSVGTLNPLTIDLDLVTPGIQHTATIVDDGGTLIFSVNNSGLVTVDYTGYNFDQPGYMRIPYVVANSNGTISNVAFIVLQVPDE